MPRVFIYGTLYQAIETAIERYLGRKLFYELFWSMKTTVPVTWLLSTYFTVILVKHFHVGEEAAYVLALKKAF